MAAISTRHWSPGCGRGAAAAWSSLALSLVWFVMALQPGSAGCRPIRFAVLEAAPPFVHAELALAMQEIHQRSGLVFEEVAGGADAPLSISWGVPDDDRRTTSDSTLSHHDAPRRLGFGRGVWRVGPGQRELQEGSVEIDASLAWPLGTDRGDSLATAFVHELGHVVGLHHNPESSSYMYASALARPPAWTPAEEVELARLGQLSGCPPTAS
ncbi:MAG TPA: matrixin family metalloprotease [Acidimicrobiales bacterium]|nr:matrixin family metalloprotease [Acidimicrobiales bacterium]